MPGIAAYSPAPVVASAYPPDAAPRVLVADDDAASRQFIGDGLRVLGAYITVCIDGASALACAREELFDLLLLDRQMPGAGARDILASLRADPLARSAQTRAVATTAELDPADRDELLAIGFSEILIKPCTLARLQKVLGQNDDAAPLLLDDAAALSSSGDESTMRALRGLLRHELAVLHRELDELGTEPVSFGERLHRLRSSCGFCGAAALGEQAAQLQQQLARGVSAGAEDIAAALQRFRIALLDTLGTLDRPEA